MTGHLYRFRSTRFLLDDDYQELENQQIYFCPPGQLNDPQEGFKDIFWRGDHIVWRNLLRHYLLNLMQAASLTAIMGQEFTPHACTTLIYQTEDDLPHAPIRDIYAAICQAFFAHPSSQNLIATLSSQERSVRRDELIFFLRMMQPLATSKVFEAFGKRGLMPMLATTKLDAIAESMGCCRFQRHFVKVVDETGVSKWQREGNSAGSSRLKL